MSFVHLHRHSEFSRLDGLGTAVQYAELAAQLGQGGLGQTDHGTMSGALHHIQACWKNGIQPISGVEAYFRPDRAKAKADKDRRQWHLTLFAKNLRGWHNLLRLTSASYAEVEDGGGFYDKPCVDWELLERHKEGLIVSSGCISSWLAQLILNGDYLAARDYVRRMQNIFGDDFWLEIQPHDFDDQRKVNIAKVRLAHELGVRLIAMSDVHFPYAEWADTHRIAKILGSGSCFSKVQKDAEAGKADYLSDLNPSLYLCSEREMALWFHKHHPEIRPADWGTAMDGTGELVASVVPFLLDKTNKLPRVAESPDEARTILRAWVEEGMERLEREYPASHWESWPKQLYRDRIEREWIVLRDKGVIDYFVMVGDIVRWAKSQGIRVGLGRGSAAGCLISYLVGIVGIDPISWGFLFERFLNAERKGLPDIDLDFESERRHEVKAYIADKYGRDHVADIITHSTFQPKKVLQDLCRVYDTEIEFLDGKAVTDSIDIRADDEETTLEELVPLNDKLRKFSEDYPEIWKHALRLEGQIANAGKHAAGIIITPKPVAEYMALERGKQGDLVTSWSDAADFPAVSDHGLVKLDALGLTGLSKHEYACQLIEKRTGVKVLLEKLGPLRNPYAVEPQVMRIFVEGLTVGVFQCASRGMTALLKDVAPENALHLCATNALYRPGAMKSGVTWLYPKLKNGATQPEYWHPLVEPILAETFGLPAFQEQIMQISQALGGFSGSEADDLRKAMGKLYRIKGGTAARDYMKQYVEKWFTGCEANGIALDVAEEIWDKILQWGSYGFNKPHAGSYSCQSYQDAWIKAYYPAEFYAAFLTYEDDEDKKKAALREAKQAFGIEIVHPNIETSDVGYTVDQDGRLVLGLQSIVGIGERSGAQLIKQRPFKNFEDYMARGSKEADTRAMIESGALDSLADRSLLLSTVTKVGSKSAAEWQVWEHLKHNLTLKKPRPIPDERRAPSGEQLAIWQAHALNMHASAFTLTPEERAVLMENVYTPEELAGLPNRQRATVGGEIIKIERKKTVKKKDFANVTLVFEEYEWRVKFWEEQLIQFAEFLEPGEIIMVAGQKEEWKGNLSVTARNVTRLADLMEATSTP